LCLVKCLTFVSSAHIGGVLTRAQDSRFVPQQPQAEYRGLFVGTSQMSDSGGAVSRFQGHQSIELGADVGHASRDHHTAGTKGVLTTLMDTQDAQTGLTFVRGRLALGW